MGMFRHLCNHIFRVRSFRKQNLRGSSFISKCSRFNPNFRNAEKNREKFFVSEKIAYEFVQLNCPYSEQDTCHRQPMCSQAVARFGMSIKIFSNSNALKVINKYGKGAVIQFSTVFGPAQHAALRIVLSKKTLQTYLGTFSQSVFSEIQNL